MVTTRIGPDGGLPARPARRVALFANTSWYVWNFRRRLLDELGRRGFQINVIAPDDSYFDRLRGPPVDCHLLPMSRAGINPFAELAVVLRLGILLARLKPEALLTFTPKSNIYGGLAARALDIPMLSNISGLGGNLQHQSTQLLDLLVRQLYRLALVQSRTVFFQNPEDREGFVAAGLVDGAKCIVLPGSGVDLRHFTPVRDDPEGDHRFTFLLSSRLLWSKGVGLFVEAARAMRYESPACRFILLGIVDSGNPDAVPRRTVEQWHRAGDIEFIEAVDDVRPHVRAADCVVLPSMYREGTPRSLLEAAAMGKPIITTDRPGCRTVVEDGKTGFLCAPNDLQDLLRKMRLVRNLSGIQLMSLGEAARRKMEREFDDSIILRQYLAALQA